MDSVTLCTEKDVGLITVPIDPHSDQNGSV